MGIFDKSNYIVNTGNTEQFLAFASYMISCMIKKVPQARAVRRRTIWSAAAASAASDRMTEH